MSAKKITGIKNPKNKTNKTEKIGNDFIVNVKEEVKNIEKPVCNKPQMLKI